MLPNVDKTSDIWKSLSLHMTIASEMMQHALTREALIRLAHTIFDWQVGVTSLPVQLPHLPHPTTHPPTPTPLHHMQELFLSINEYQSLFKPKAHWYSHFPDDIFRFGTTRQYWCMRFEGMNQFFKRVAVHGSFRDTLYRCALP
jgi:hypothetical protein